MAKPSGDDPVGATDDWTLNEPASPVGRSRSRPARSPRAGDELGTPVGGPSPRARWIIAVSTVVALVVVVPIAVSAFAGVSRAQTAAAEAEGSAVEVVVVSAEAQSVLGELEPIEAAFLMSNGIAEGESRGKLGDLIGTVKERAQGNDVSGARDALEEALPYFVQVYSQRLADSAEAKLAEFPFSEAETDDRIAELVAIIRANSDGHDLSGLVAAVIELPQRIGDAKSEHLLNRTTYVPPAPKPTATEAPPATTPPPAETPEPTVPEETVPPTEDNPTEKPGATPPGQLPDPTGTTLGDVFDWNNNKND